MQGERANGLELRLFRHALRDIDRTDWLSLCLVGLDGYDQAGRRLPKCAGEADHSYYCYFILKPSENSAQSPAMPREGFKVRTYVAPGGQFIYRGLVLKLSPDATVSCISGVNPGGRNPNELFNMISKHPQLIIAVQISGLTEPLSAESRSMRRLSSW